ncbi:hypothetical protein PENANT_c056G00630 [Penicillium antarcticum]|uniref:Uncharacterized protein n=1 Tax=Penicillium antarcticum TaxID=416450 RepID=A0A1V6PRW7_9EURO|nr:hypothetical protein PENANT_c056G00630 [Penicillium antarcticum]
MDDPNQYHDVQLERVSCGYSDGSYGIPTNDGNSGGTFYSLSLADRFNIETTNSSSLFSKGPNPAVAQPNFEDGAMFGNDREIILYGQDVPNATEALGYRFSDAGSDHDEGSFFNSSLPGNMTRYVTNGGPVSVPSEDLAFYFGGMRGRDWGPITSDDASANTSANTLIAVNMAANGDQPIWRNLTLPNYVASRANPQLVWIPVSQQGVLAVIGGVKTPEEIYPSGLSSTQQKLNVRLAPALRAQRGTLVNPAQSLTDPDFMTIIPIYDIALDTWYLQNATGDVPSGGRSSFCSTVASALDGSSHNIYIYGGYNGEDSTTAPYDDVYILSLPSFIWIRAYTGKSRHGRSGHQCFGVLPSHMLVVGGLYKDPSICLDGGILQTFSLNDLKFQTTYSPEAVEEYRVPSVVSQKIGGTTTGNASRTAPESWGDPQLKSLFDTPYTKTVTTWYPYTTSGKPLQPKTTAVRASMPQKKGWIMPVAVGVSVPTVGAACVIMIWLAIKRKRHLQHGLCHCSPRRRHWLHLLCLKSDRSRPNEADGVPVEPQPAVRSVRVVGSECNELPAHVPPSTKSNRSSIAETPTHMYLRGLETPGVAQSLEKMHPSLHKRGL